MILPIFWRSFQNVLSEMCCFNYGPLLHLSRDQSTWHFPQPFRRVADIFQTSRVQGLTFWMRVWHKLAVILARISKFNASEKWVPSSLGAAWLVLRQIAERPLTFAFIMYLRYIYWSDIHYIALLPRRQMGFFAESPPPEDSGIKIRARWLEDERPRHGIIFARADAPEVWVGRTRSGSILALGDASLRPDKVIIIINGAPTVGSAALMSLANWRLWNNCGPPRARNNYCTACNYAQWIWYEVRTRVNIYIIGLCVTSAMFVQELLPPPSGWMVFANICAPRELPQ